jgi:hypothetical protein
MSDPHASASSPAEDEPKTPMWLPALGAALFVSAGLWWAVTPGAPPPPVADEPVASASAPATAPPTIAPRPQPVPVPPSTAPNPVPRGMAPLPAGMTPAPNLLQGAPGQRGRKPNP